MGVVVELGLVLLDVFFLKRVGMKQQRLQPLHPTNQQKNILMIESKMCKNKGKL